MVSEPGLVRCPGFKPPLCNLKDYLVCSTLHERVWGRIVRENVEKHDIHIKFKSYKFKLLR